MIDFVGRDDVLADLLAADAPDHLWSLFGEPGMGKTRLLTEAARRLASARPEALVVSVDLAQLPPGRKRLQQLLSTLSHACGYQGQPTADEQSGAAALAEFLEQVGYRQPVYLFFDNLDAPGNDGDFWVWLETHLVGPLSAHGNLHIVFAGRLPAPWRAGARRRAQLVRLEPLTPAQAADLAGRALAAALADGKIRLTPDQQAQVVRDGVELSAGHPGLLLSLVSWVGEHGVSDGRALAEAVVSPYLLTGLWGGLDDAWRRILWLASPLAWFDADLLKAYLTRLDSTLLPQPATAWDAHFFEGTANLHARFGIISWRNTGYRFDGVGGRIARRCFQVLTPADFEAARRVADELGQAADRVLAGEAAETDLATRPA